MKTFLVTNLPAQYRIDLFNRLYQSAETDIQFCFLRESAIDYKNQIGVFADQPFLEASRFYYEDSAIRRHLRFARDLLMHRPGVIVNGGMSPRTLFLVLYCRLSGARLYIWWAGTRHSEAGIHRLKQVFRKFIARNVTGVLNYSEYAREYFDSLVNSPAESVTIGNNTRNAAAYHEAVLAFRHEKQRTRVRFLSVGFQTTRKNTIALLQAMEQLGVDNRRLELVVAGDGPEITALQDFARQNKLDNVIFRGHVTPEDMIGEYANSDVFIHPSLLDQWPQTYNEAAAAGLPVLISNRSGVYNEYIREFEEQTTFDPHNTQAIATAMRRLAEDRELRQRLADKALQTALRFDVEFAADAWLGLIRKE